MKIKKAKEKSESFSLQMGLLRRLIREVTAVAKKKQITGGAGGLYRLNIPKRFRKEDEALAVGSVNASHIEWRLLEFDGDRFDEKNK